MAKKQASTALTRRNKSKTESSQVVVKKTTSKKKNFFELSLLKRGLLKLLGWLAYPFIKIYKILRGNRKQSPHKTFQLTRRRDLPKRPKLEGYIAFPWYVARTLWRDKWLYIRLTVVYLILIVIAMGSVQFTNMGVVNELIDATNEEAGGSLLAPAGRAFVIAGSALGGALSTNLTDIQYLFVFMVGFFVVITVVWLLRQRLAGNKVNVRDGLYSSGAPVLALYVLIVIGILQMIPLALMVLVYAAAVGGGILSGGIDTAMFSIALFLVLVLTLYFMTTTLFAIFIATLPGTYPIVAYRTARKIVAGQRARLLFRLIWLAVIVVAMWFMVLVPIVIITNSLNGQNSIVIPLAVQTMLGAGLIYAAAYAYLLYRRMIDDPTK